MGRPALAIGGVALICAGVAIAFSSWRSDSAEQDHQLAQTVTSVQLATSSGDVRVVARDVTTTSVHETFHYSGSQPGQGYRLDGATLVLAGCGHDCTVDYDIVVPRGTAVHGNLTSGDVTLDGVVGTDVTSTSGQIRVTGAAGPVKAHATSGDIEISLASPEDVNAQANSGNVTVTVPNDRYRVDVLTHSGEQEVGIPTDPAGAYVLDLQATSGDVRVEPA